MLGVIPAAGAGTRIQPLAFSKELLPVGVRIDGGIEHPRAVSEYLVERLITAGADRLCFVISPGKSDILEYYGGNVEGVPVCYVVQPAPAGLCDAVFRSLPFVRPGEPVAVGLPDTVWFPRDALRTLPDDQLGFLLFPVQRPQLFDAVVTDERGRVVDIQVKVPQPTSSWIWGAFKVPHPVMNELHALWLETGCQDQYIGGLVNRYLARGGQALGVRAGVSYVDVGTLHGYREALTLLQGAPRVDPPTAQPPAPEARHESVRSSGP
jgi:glucose-1-phosphate thymidylyltransferase